VPFHNDESDSLPAEDLKESFEDSSAVGGLRDSFCEGLGQSSGCAGVREWRAEDDNVLTKVVAKATTKFWEMVS